MLALLRRSIECLRYYEDLEEASTSEIPHRCLSAWLESLQECGVNLEEYGQAEIDLQDQGQVSWSFYSRKFRSTWVLTGLTCGPQPSDWKITWELRDKETPYIPGGWIGDDDGDDEDGSVEDEEEEYSAEDDEDEEYSAEDDEEECSAEDEDEDDSIGEVYEDCSIGDVSAQATRTD